MSSKLQQTKKFTALIESSDDGKDTAYISIPYDVEKMYGTKGIVKVKATFDGYPYRGVLANMGTGCHIIGLRKDVRVAIAKNAGDLVKVTIEQDFDERTVTLPVELKKIFKTYPKAENFFTSLSYTNQKEYVTWITSARKSETKTKRLEAIAGKLLTGKKNPSAK